MANTVVTCGIFLYSHRAGKFLVCHPTNARWNQWSIPKGLPEADEDELAAASRELMEETAIDINMIGDKDVSSLPPSRYLKQNKELRSFLVTTQDTFEKHNFKSTLVPGKNIPEIDSWKWIALEEGERWIHESQARLIENIRAVINTHA